MTELPEREVLEALWNRVFGEPPVAGDWQTGADFDQFTAMLDAGAYLDAALMLFKVVPDRIPSDPLLIAEDAMKQHEVAKNG